MPNDYLTQLDHQVRALRCLCAKLLDLIDLVRQANPTPGAHHRLTVRLADLRRQLLELDAESHEDLPRATERTRADPLPSES